MRFSVARIVAMLFDRRSAAMRKRIVLALAVCWVLCVGLSGCFLFPNRPPVAAVVVHYNVNATDPMIVELDASGSTDPDGDAIVQYKWVFYDNFTILEPLAFSTVVAYPNLLVRCPSEGQYMLGLVVVDGPGALIRSPGGDRRHGSPPDALVRARALRLEDSACGPVGEFGVPDPTPRIRNRESEGSSRS